MPEAYFMQCSQPRGHADCHLCVELFLQSERQEGVRMHAAKLKTT
jgi:hypothetical protein